MHVEGKKRTNYVNFCVVISSGRFKNVIALIFINFFFLYFIICPKQPGYQFHFIPVKIFKYRRVLWDNNRKTRFNIFVWLKISGRFWLGINLINDRVDTQLLMWYFVFFCTHRSDKTPQLLRINVADAMGFGNTKSVWAWEMTMVLICPAQSLLLYINDET